MHNAVLLLLLMMGAYIRYYLLITGRSPKV